MKLRIALGLLLLGVVAGCGTSSPPPPAGAAPAQPGPCSQSVQIDGFSDELDQTDFQGNFVGNFSGLATQPDGGILALSDRSVLFTLDGRTHRPVAAVPLADENGKPLDSEAIARDRDGTLLITSETEPSVRRYTADGKPLDRLPVPAPLAVAPAGRAVTNGTFEGIAPRPDGTLVASMEGPLSGDDPMLRRFQTWTRAADGRFTPAAQWAYRIHLPSAGVSELVPTGDGRLLVLERGFVRGTGNTVQLYLADPAGAPDVSGTDRLDAATPPIANVLLADLASCPSMGATSPEPQVNPLLDNIEGATVLGRDPDGALRLLLVSDDNQSASQITRLYSFTVRLPHSPG